MNILHQADSIGFSLDFLYCLQYMLFSDTCFVNSADMSDVQFIVDGRRFYAHRLILVQASARFRLLLNNHAFVDDMGNTCIELTDVKYHILEVRYGGRDIRLIFCMTTHNGDYLCVFFF